MPVLTLSNEQVLEIVKQLPFDMKLKVWMVLSEELQAKQEGWSAQISGDLRRIAQQRGLNWDTLDEEARMQLVDDLIHEQRRCAP